MSSESDSETEIDISDSGSDYSTSNESDISSEISDSDDDDSIQSARQWCEVDSSDPAPPRFLFKETPIVHGTFESILEYFEYFMSDNVIGIITEQTNKYAGQCIASGDAKKMSRINKWYATTSNEIRVFLAIFILQGIIKKPVEEWYWSRDQLISTPFFPRLMSYHRYVLLKRFLHFSDNSTYDASLHPNPKLNKIWPIFKELNELFQHAVMLERDVTIDESLMLYKGRLGWIQYLPLKRARFEIKTFMLCEAKSGYIWSTIIYTGKGTVLDPEYKDLPVSMQIVMTLMKPLLGKGYCLTTDNYYTAPVLADLLVQQQTDTYGTVKLNRKEMPPQMLKKKLKKGENVAYRRGKVLAIKWKDKKDVTLLSTVHASKMIEVQGYKEKKIKPAVVHDYNDNMGGVDRVDQHLTNYPVTRKRGKRYYKKIFFHLMDQVIWNAYVLYNKQGGSKNHLKFRLDLVSETVQKYHTTNMSSKKGRPSTEGNPLRLTERHFPKFIPPTPKKDKPARKCVVCCNKRDARGKRVRKETRYYCQECDLGMCVVPCFEEYHTKINY